MRLTSCRQMRQLGEWYCGEVGVGRRCVWRRRFSAWSGFLLSQCSSGAGGHRIDCYAAMCLSRTLINYVHCC